MKFDKCAFAIFAMPWFNLGQGYPVDLVSSGLRCLVPGLCVGRRSPTPSGSLIGRNEVRFLLINNLCHLYFKWAERHVILAASPGIVMMGMR